MEPGRYETLKIATGHKSPPFVVFNIRPPRQTLRCNAEATRPQHGSSAAARSAPIVSALGGEVNDCCWVRRR